MANRPPYATCSSETDAFFQMKNLHSYKKLQSVEVNKGLLKRVTTRTGKIAYSKVEDILLPFKNPIGILAFNLVIPHIYCVRGP